MKRFNSAQICVGQGNNKGLLQEWGRFYCWLTKLLWFSRISMETLPGFDRLWEVIKKLSLEVSRTRDFCIVDAKSILNEIKLTTGFNWNDFAECWGSIIQYYVVLNNLEANGNLIITKNIKRFLFTFIAG